MQRCFDLARLGAGNVSPNPMVGAVLVHQNRIIGEGYHERYGQAHAEVNAVNSVKEADKHLIKESTFYVSLEPCNFHGRTPACTGLIIKHKIPKVVISVIDQTPQVSGQGLETLRAAGVEVITGILPKKGSEVAQIRNTFAYQNRPFVLLKYAQSKDQKLAPLPAKQLWLSNAYSKRLTHRWRMEHDAILIGANTALVDDPSLTNRLYYGRSPIRIVLDPKKRLPKSLNIFDKQVKTMVIVDKGLAPKMEATENLEDIAIDYSENFIPNLLSELASRKITSLLVEGGKETLESFIKSGYWDEARVYQSQKWIGKGLLAPKLDQPVDSVYQIGN
ncbi:MAG: bifunctional diaminohydroxyphosphoribosylaminopyrimidine deaminase/5-amino-6-(5-phosphoribosylamino)uracil reductase RibD, partial [Bacteroidota bacterium]